MNNFSLGTMHSLLLCTNKIINPRLHNPVFKELCPLLSLHFAPLVYNLPRRRDLFRKSFREEWAYFVYNLPCRRDLWRKSFREELGPCHQNRDFFVCHSMHIVLINNEFDLSCYSTAKLRSKI